MYNLNTNHGNQLLFAFWLGGADLEEKTNLLGRH